MKFNWTVWSWVLADWLAMGTWVNTVELGPEPIAEVLVNVDLFAVGIVDVESETISTDKLNNFD